LLAADGFDALPILWVKDVLESFPESKSRWCANKRRDAFWEGLCPKMFLSTPASLFFRMFCSKIERAEESLDGIDLLL
jgi:hypothetical protein